MLIKSPHDKGIESDAWHAVVPPEIEQARDVGDPFLKKVNCLEVPRPGAVESEIYNAVAVQSLGAGISTCDMAAASCGTADPDGARYVVSVSTRTVPEVPMK